MVQKAEDGMRRRTRCTGDDRDGAEGERRECWQQRRAAQEACYARGVLQCMWCYGAARAAPASKECCGSRQRAVARTRGAAYAHVTAACGNRQMQRENGRVSNHAGQRRPRYGRWKVHGTKSAKAASCATVARPASAVASVAENTCRARRPPSARPGTPTSRHAASREATPRR